MADVNEFLVSKGYEYKDINLPKRKTTFSAGYDFEAAEDVLIPAGEVKMVPTGVKCRMWEGLYLALSIRSSVAIKRQLMLANGVGIVDSDYADNPDNDGHIMFPIYNAGTASQWIQKGERIGQGILQQWFMTEYDDTLADREGGFGSTGL